MIASTAATQQGQIQVSIWPRIMSEGEPQIISPGNQQQHQSKTSPRSYIEVPATGSKKKLRESCNNCALSKVKCSKDQPICTRCGERNLFCRYSLSRRTGKRGPASRSSSSSSNSPSMITESTDLSMNMESNSPSDHTPWFEFRAAGRKVLPKNSRECSFSRSKPKIQNVSPQRSCTPPDNASSFEFQHTRSDSFPSRGYEILNVLEKETIPQSISPKRSKPNTPRVQTTYPNVCTPRTLDDNLMTWDDIFFPIDLSSQSIDASSLENSMGPASDFITPTYYNDITPTPTSFDAMTSPFAIMSPENKTPMTMTPRNNLFHQNNNQYQQLLDPIVRVEPAPLQSPLRNLHTTSPDCTILALTTLQTLHMPLPTCNSYASHSSTSSLPLPTIDHVLSSNKSVVDSLMTIMSCSCSFDTDTSLLLTVMVSKMITSYGAIARTNTELVLGELQLMMRLVDQLVKRLKSSSNAKPSGRIENIGYGVDAWNNGSGTLTMMTELGNFLRKQIREVMEETMGLLQER